VRSTACLAVLVAAALPACGEEPAATGGAGGVVSVGECLARAGARPASTAADLRFARSARPGQTGIALDGRTTYEFLPRESAGGDWRVFRTRAGDERPPQQAAEAPLPGEEVAVLAPPAAADAVERARGCADGAPE